MGQFRGFNGPSNRQRSYAVEASRTINRITERVDAGTPVDETPSYLRPALGSLFTYLGSGAVRALFSLNNRTFGVSGANLWELNPSGTVTWRGDVALGGVAAQITSNGTLGNQLLIIAGFHGYILDLLTNAFTEITDDAFPEFPIQCTYTDDSFLVLDISGRFYVSALDDGLDWNALDSGQQSQTADTTIALLRSHDNILLGGSQTMAPWVNTGTGGAGGYQPQPGTIIEHGVAAPFSMVEIDNKAYYLGADANGQGQAWRLDGYTPQRFSTNWFENYISKDVNGQPITSYANAIGWGLQLEGHTFYGLSIPGLETTPVYDIATGEWSEWGHWDNSLGRYVPFFGVNHCFAFGKHLMGARNSGAVWEVDFNRYNASTGLYGYCADALVA